MGVPGLSGSDGQVTPSRDMVTGREQNDARSGCDGAETAFRAAFAAPPAEWHHRCSVEAQEDTFHEEHIRFWYCRGALD